MDEGCLGQLEFCYIALIEDTLISSWNLWLASQVEQEPSFETVRDGQNCFDANNSALVVGAFAVRIVRFRVLVLHLSFLTDAVIL